jgi:outer membrane lipoprotein-sorting protein
MLSTVLQRAGKVRGFRTYAASIALCASSLIVADAAHAETVADVLKKMADNYTKAKTYQVSITTLQTGKTPQGKAFTVTQTEHLAYASPNKFHKSVKIAGSGAAVAGPTAAAQLAQRQGEIFSDGKTATMYVPARKQYQRQPVPPSVQLPQLVDLLRLVPAASRPGLTLLPTQANVHGRAAYIIEIRPVTPKGMKPADLKKYNEGLKQYKQFPRFLIDRQNYSLLQYSLLTTGGGAQVDLNSQAFGAPIPESTFVFSPPPGSTEFHAPTTPPGHPGGTPAIPGGSPLPGGKR